MNGSQPLQKLRHNIRELTSDVLSQRFFHDRMSMAVLGVALGVNTLSLVNLMLIVRPTSSQLPVHFSSITQFSGSGPWYFPFEIMLGSLVITIMNAVFAYHSFSKSRLVSFFLLVTSVVVSVFGFIIAQAFGVLR